MAKQFLSTALCLILISTMFCACKNKTTEIIKIPVSKDCENLDPQISTNETSKLVINNCFEGLVRLGKGERIIPGVASSWKISADKCTYTFALRHDTKWYFQEGLEDVLGENYNNKYRTTVTANDFVFGITRALDPNTKSPNAYKLFSIKNAKNFNSGKSSKNDLGIRSINDHTLEIKLEYPSVNFLNNLTDGVAMPCHEEFFNKTSGKYGKKVSFTLCNGPFYLRRWYENSFISLLRNDNYSGEQKVIPSGVKFDINPDSSTYLKKLLAGAYDVIPITKEQVKKIEKDEKVNILRFKNTVWSLCINNNSKIIQNSNFKNALIYSTNSNVLNNVSSDKAQGIIPPSCFLTFGAPYRVQANSINFKGYNLNKAQNYWDKFKKENVNLTLSLSVLCLEEHKDLVKKIAQDWQKVFGINFSISVITMNSDDIIRRVNLKNYDIAFVPIKCNYILAENFLYNFETENAYNLINFSSEQYDNVLDKVRKSKNQNELLENCKNAESILLAHGGIYPSYYEENLIATSPKLRGLYVFSNGNNFTFTSATKGEK